jgi:hypothetical protein
MGIRSGCCGNIDCLQGGGRHLFFPDFFLCFFAESQFQIKMMGIHDDITLFGPPELIFGDANSMVFLENRLELQGLKVNRGKCAVLGTSHS